MRRSVFVAMAALVVLAGCGGDPKAGPSPSRSSAPVSTTPSPTAPAMPAAASENTKAGAIAFVRYYIELINHAQATGDTTTLQRVEAPGCESCIRGRQYIDQVYSSGGHIENGSLRIKVLNSLRNESIDGWTIDGQLTFGPQTIVNLSATPTTQELKGGGVAVTVLLSNRSHSWSVVNWTRAR